MIYYINIKNNVLLNYFYSRIFKLVTFRQTMEALSELVGFLKNDTRIDVKSLALHHILSMTGAIDTKKLLIKHEKVINDLILIAFKKNEQKSINKDALFALINLNADEDDALRIIEKNPILVRMLIDSILDESCAYADTLCAILANLSRGKKNCQIIFEKYFLETPHNDANNNGKPEEKRVSNEKFQKLLKVFCTENFNKTNNLNYLAPFLCNLTQLDSVRQLILDDVTLIQRLLPYTTYTKSDIRRGGILGSIKNCCFNYGNLRPPLVFNIFWEKFWFKNS